MVLVLLSTSVERVSVSRMRDFLTGGANLVWAWWRREALRRKKVNHSLTESLGHLINESVDHKGVLRAAPGFAWVC